MATTLTLDALRSAFAVKTGNEMRSQVETSLAASSRLPPKERVIAQSLLKATTLLQADHLREALDQFARLAESLHRPSSVNLLLLYQGLIQAWGLTAALYTVTEGFLPRRLEPAEYGVAQFLTARKFASKIGLPKMAKEITDQVSLDGIGAMVARAELRGLTEQEKEAVEELNTAIRLMAIEDPFEGWEALSEEMSKDWPKGLSAAEEIRQQREG